MILDHKSILHSLGQFLVVEGAKLQPADVIHVLGGRLERTYFALQLYHQGYGHKLFFTGEEIAPLLKAYAPYKGVLAEDVIKFESKAANTYQEAVELKQLLEQDPTLHSVLVVSSPYHMRRVRWIFEQVLGNQANIQFAPVPFESSWDHPQWWTDRMSKKRVINEYLKLFVYWVKYRVG